MLFLQLNNGQVRPTGPKSRDVLSKLFPDLDDYEGLPFMGYTEGKLFGIDAKIFRISFSGELAYEINVKSDNGLFMGKKSSKLEKSLICNLMEQKHYQL